MHPYMQELATDIAVHGGLKPGQTVDQAMAEAHSRRQAFALEMLEGQTDRARKARRILAAQVYAALAVSRTVSDMDREEAEAGRLEFCRAERARIESEQ